MRISRFIALVLACTALPPLARLEARASATTLLVAFRQGVGLERVAASVAGTGGRVVASLPGGAVIRTGSPGSLAASLAASPAVAAVDADGTVLVAGPPSDPRFSDQWNLEQPSDADIDARKGWARVFGVGPKGYTRFPPPATGPLVGIIDTGVDLGHPDLRGIVAACARASNGEVSSGGCADAHGHGTAIAGIQAARTDNGRGIAGAGPGLRLAVCKALGPGGTGAWSDVLACAGWLTDHGARAIGMSFTGEFNAVAEAVLEGLWDEGRGPLLLAAAGNGGIHATSYPAGFENVVSVTASNRWDGRWSFSNLNPDVELAAPGHAILSTKRGGGYAPLSGTSAAVPHAAAIAGLMAGLRPAWDGLALREILRRSAEDLGPVGRDQSFGWGRVNLARAVRAVARD